ncbi:FtsX-like permease family protein [Stenotrophomonas maltophilia]|jgi:putative ABC transport system permease protein|uniref:ABC transporter permease n=2 Tax=Stenotrophomonas TaxID=40323 RepID=A0AA40Y7X5_STEMA|nr:MULTISPECIES: FtsX-like permease family protein [Stenotrophomonas]AWB79974.1 ABC transporter permease [Stenotrophomonas maltophilia]CCH14202.1 ABC transporter permease [Stenotrophomonas maltophilia D457]KKF86340.1 ABC transporter permease [Stenotrophomonas maltophilia]KLN98792.1 ABC transporter permease [Stenotrophomonas maltophilia]KOO86101.1 ABC transporter permease [Stenotrophomonas maltophilia]
MDIRPILSTLRRHKTAAALIVLEVALTCAIVCNALFLVTQRVERISQTSGLAENELVFVRVSGIGKQTNGQARTQEDLSALRAVPGVTAAAKVNQLPFRPNSSNTSVSLKQEQERPTAFVTMYMFGEGGLSTLGLQLTAGRDFQPSEYSNVEDAQKNASTNTASSVIISRTLADRLYPGENALGKTFYMGKQPLHVVGIVASLATPTDYNNNTTLSMVLPVRTDFTQGPYVLRTAPERREEVLKGAIAALERNDPNRLVREKLTYEAQRNDYFKNDRAMVGLLITVCISLLVVTALGIIGLASFWVQQRSKQIGIRRALGATRGQILRYFQTENFLLATLGIVLGMLAAYAINLALMNMYELPRMPLHYLPLGALLLWVLGQIAVFGPARRAAAVPPAVATRGA